MTNVNRPPVLTCLPAHVEYFVLIVIRMLRIGNVVKVVTYFLFHVSWQSSCCYGLAESSSFTAGEDVKSLLLDLINQSSMYRGSAGCLTDPGCDLERVCVRRNRFVA